MLFRDDVEPGFLLDFACGRLRRAVLLASTGPGE